ncbi:MAG: methyltransferase domain-containing protein [Candidatus Coatesbacteria bacterium]|nr:methyltransferase domain-containing protein [Candidatus Coatesbacteria bacterium]
MSNVTPRASMPFPDSSYELVISRGSFPFWEDKVGSFGEVCRVPKPGGISS